MHPDFVISLLVQSILVGASVMLPLLAVGLTVGLAVGSIQAATQVNEQTLTFVPKVIAVGTTAWFIVPWGLDRYIFVFRQAIEAIAQVVAV
ncbi:MAG: flagellar biosynthetic protein FliQ [Deltaproteobacteria bacterium]|jgi:flagellar biosynthetic protein FliQ